MFTPASCVFSRPEMRADEADLAAYYDQEAALRANRPIDPRRVRARNTFIDLLDVELRSAVVEVGSGPGRDAEAFVEAGHPITAVDLSIEHARLASRDGVAALQGSLYSLPFAPASFDAGWTMSTLVHIPDSRFDEAMTSITSVLRDVLYAIFAFDDPRFLFNRGRRGNNFY